MKRSFLKEICFVLLLVVTTISMKAQTNFYYKGTGNFINTASWGTNTDGSGTAPADFTSNNQVFIIVNNTSIVHSSGNFTVTGTGSKIVMGNPTYATPATASAAISITIAAGSQITSGGNVNFEVSLPSSGNHRIIYQNTSAISFSTAINDPNLELVFDGTTLSTTTNRSFGNVSLINNATVTMAGASIVVNNLTVAEGSTLIGPIDGSANYIAIKTGGIVTINGIFRAGRTGTVTAPAIGGGLFSTGITIPVTAVTANATLLFQSSSASIILGSNSTIDYYRGTSGQTGTQGIAPLAYANLILSNSSVASGKSFAIAGDITVSGTLTINLIGSASITAPSSTTNITLLPTARLVINSATTFPTNGKLILKSTASGTATIGNIATGASITGNVTIEKFIAGGVRRHRFLSHPFTTAQNLNQLSLSIDITGNTAGTTGLASQTVGTGFAPTASNNPSAYFFNTANANGGVTTDNGWTAFVDTIATSWGRGQGIRILTRGSKAQANTLNGTDATPNAATIVMSGVVNTGNVAVNLVTGGTGATAGFNFVGNPFASDIDLGAVLSSATNIGSAFYIRNPQTGSYTTVPVSASYILPAYTAFFVQATAPTTLTFTEANKGICTSCPTVFSTQKILPKFEIKAFENNIENDNLYVVAGNYNGVYDNKTDASKLLNDGLNIYTLSTDNKKLAANYINETSTESIKLGISLPKAYGKKTYTLKVTTCTVNDGITLYDAFTNTYTPIKEGAEYALLVDPSNHKSIGENRLKIIFSKSIKSIGITPQKPVLIEKEIK